MDDSRALKNKKTSLQMHNFAYLNCALGVTEDLNYTNLLSSLSFYMKNIVSNLTTLTKFTKNGIWEQSLLCNWIQMNHRFGWKSKFWISKFVAVTHGSVCTMR